MRALEKNKNQFYTYVLLDPRVEGDFSYGFGESELKFKYEPYYVGKGVGTRWKQHFHDTVKHRYNIIKAYKIDKLTRLGFDPCVAFLIKNVNEDLAYEVEGEAILTIGRSRVKQGPLLNITDGRGMAGNTGFTMSEEAKAKISHAHVGKVVKESTKEKLRQFKGELHGQYGTTISEDLLRIKKVVHTKYRFTVQTPSMEIVTVFNMTQFAKDNNLSDSHIYQTYTGNRSHHKGFIIIGKEELPSDWINTDIYTEFLLGGGDDIKPLFVHRAVYPI